MAQTLHISSIGDGLPLVLLHGWGLNSAIFKPLAEQLSSHFKVIMVDLPGYGHSSHCVPESYSLLKITKLITDQINEPAVYIGWSLGGLIATEIALNQPSEKVLGLVTLASSPCFEQKEQWFGIKPELLTAFHQQIAKNIEQTLNGFLKIQAMGSPHIKDDIKLIQQLVMAAPLPDRFALDQGLNLLSEVDLRARLHEVTQPFLRIYGKMDGLVPKKIIPMIDDLAPNSESIVFEKASHAPFISNFQEFTDGLVSWLVNQKFYSECRG